MCEKSTEAFVNILAVIHHGNFRKNMPIDETNDKKVKRQIIEWIKTGKETPVVNNLLSGEESKNFPIWWSGFYLEDPNPLTNPVNDMKTASLLLKGYSSLDTKMGNALTEQNEFWKECSKMKDFKWGTYISETYTKMALRKNPKNIGLFINKEIPDFIKSAFFITEIRLINQHYKDINKKVNFHIFNLNKNCDALIDKLKPEFTNINFKCYNDCPTLVDCVNTRYFPTTTSTKKKSKSSSSKSSKSSSGKTKSFSSKTKSLSSRTKSSSSKSSNSSSSKKRVGDSRETKKRRLH